MFTWCRSNIVDAWFSLLADFVLRPAQHCAVVLLRQRTITQRAGGAAICYTVDGTTRLTVHAGDSLLRVDNIYRFMRQARYIYENLDSQPKANLQI